MITRTYPRKTCAMPLLVIFHKVIVFVPFHLHDLQIHYIFRKLLQLVAKPHLILTVKISSITCRCPTRPPNYSPLYCASCSSSISVTEQVVLSQSSLDLTCLQHPETRMSGKSPDLTHISATNIDALYAEAGIVIDHRGIDDETISFCKDCYSHIRKSKTPPLSLANNLLLGDVPPELQALTVVEESMIARCRAKICIIQLKAQENSVLPNAQRALHGHIIIYPQKPDNLLHVLPPTINEACIP